MSTAANNQKILQTNFGKNLRRLTESYGSLAKFSRETEINRQQLNKYLNGSALPSLAIAARISGQLDVSLDELVSLDSGEAARLRTHDSRARTVSKETNLSIEPGFYLERSISSVLPSTLVCSLVLIKEVGKKTYYHRRMPIPKPRSKHTIYWSYVGELVQTAGGVFVSYINATIDENIGAMYLRRDSPMTSDAIGIKLGVSMRSHAEQFATGVFLSMQPKGTSIRSLYRHCGSHSFDQLGEEDQFVLEQLQQRLRYENATLRVLP